MAEGIPATENQRRCGRLLCASSTAASPNLDWCIIPTAVPSMPSTVSVQFQDLSPKKGAGQWGTAQVLVCNCCLVPAPFFETVLKWDTYHSLNRPFLRAHGGAPYVHCTASPLAGKFAYAGSRTVHLVAGHPPATRGHAA